MGNNWVWGVYGSPVCLPNVRQTVVYVTPASASREELEIMAGLTGEIDFEEEDDAEF